MGYRHSYAVLVSRVRRSDISCEAMIQSVQAKMDGQIFEEGEREGGGRGGVKWTCTRDAEMFVNIEVTGKWTAAIEWQLTWDLSARSCVMEDVREERGLKAQIGDLATIKVTPYLLGCGQSEKGAQIHGR